MVGRHVFLRHRVIEINIVRSDNMEKVFLLCCLTLFACNKKKIAENASSQSRSEDKDYMDTSSNPKVDVKVNRQYDTSGNLIRFDSTYSYFYESPGLKNARIRGDSVYSQFKNIYRGHLLDSMNSEINNIFFNDSLFKYDFFNEDYFSQRFMLNEKRFEQMFREMDSIKRNILSHEFPKGSVRKN
jgi:hypothetical protein